MLCDDYNSHAFIRGVILTLVHFYFVKPARHHKGICRVCFCLSRTIKAELCAENQKWLKVSRAHTTQGPACLVSVLDESRLLAFVRWNVCYDKTAGLHVNTGRTCLRWGENWITKIFLFLRVQLRSEANGGTADLHCAAKGLSGYTWV